ncbi:Adenylate kinase family protein [Babesia bovis T2Bo]|uniref:Adenylate kinase family protein n=1 Tax=Babesia bovis T2Bo TaxID=484906 RepID=UPI001DE81607|nr:Adenylate kinase family protein [Babesia bovis T2Bo]EDO07164.2 Adenylate kinase family protein [Babesia bovis T2Bo]
MIGKSTLNAKCFLLLFFGAPGTGKGTFGRLLASDLNIDHVSSGDILRKEIQRGSTLGRRVKKIVESGLYADDDTICSIVSAELALASRSLILDGIPRTAAQAQFLKSISLKSNIPLISVDLTLDRNILVKRLLGRRHCAQCNSSYNICTISSGEYEMPPLLPSKADLLKCNGCAKLHQRPDDTEEIIQNRLLTYEKNHKEVFRALEGIPTMTFAIKRGIDDYGKFKVSFEKFLQNITIDQLL